MYYKFPLMDLQYAKYMNFGFLSFSGFFCLEGCIVAWRGVLKNAFPLAYKVEKM